MSTLEELAELPKAQIGHYLSKMLGIMRKNRVIGGERYVNATLKTKADTFQRLIRNYYLKEDEKKMLFNKDYVPRTFTMVKDPELAVLLEKLDSEMRKSAAIGKSLGCVKDLRDEISPESMRQILELYSTTVPRDLEHSFGITLMLEIGTRGGEELRSMH